MLDRNDTLADSRSVGAHGLSCTLWVLVNNGSNSMLSIELYACNWSISLKKIRKQIFFDQGIQIRNCNNVVIIVGHLDVVSTIIRTTKLSKRKREFTSGNCKRKRCERKCERRLYRRTKFCFGKFGCDIRRPCHKQLRDRTYKT